MAVSSPLARMLWRASGWLLVALGAALSEHAGAQQRPPANAIDPKAIAVQRVAVPPVAGLELGQARDLLSQRRFGSQPIALEGPPGGRREVVRTDPPAGATYPVTALPQVRLYHRRAQGDDVPPPAKMPQLIGATCSEAQQRLARDKLTLASCENGATTRSVPAGRINRQDPAPGSGISPKSTLRAWVEPRLSTVPQVVGLRIGAAVARIDAADLRAEFDKKQFDDWHWVVDQLPKAGAAVAPDSPVRLTLAPRYLVPDLVGRTCDDARNRVAAAGLSGLDCQPEAVVGATLPANRIHRQQPAPQTELRAAQNVRAWVQPPMVIVPDVVGLAEADATARVVQRQLRPQTSGPAATRGRQVATQTPAPGTSVQPNSDVRLTLLLSVPALSGLDCDSAKARAREHGLPDLSCQPRRAGPGQPIHRVFDQKPPALTLLAAAQDVVALVADPIVVPDVVGRALPAALETLAQEALKGSADANDGDREVRSQQPRAGAEVAPGSAVALTTTRFDAVPAVTGTPLPEARSRLRDRGFVDAGDHAGSAVEQRDRKVREQSPVAGTRRPVGSPVRLTTYREAVVPDVTKLRLPEAATRLEQAGLAGKPDHGDRAAEREVREQTPAAGERAPERSDVALRTVRRVTVPKLVDLSYTDARDAAENAGLVLGSCEVDSGLVPSLLLGPRTVVSHEPVKDAVVDEGSVVTCTASASAMPFVLLVAAFGAGGGVLLWRWLAARACAVALHWRVAPDPLPRLALRFADARAYASTAGTGNAGQPSAAELQVAWRRVAAESLIFMRGAQALYGEDHDEQR